MPISLRLVALLGAFVLLSACPSSKKPDGPALDGSGFPLDVVTPPVEGADPRLLELVEAMGDSVYLDAGNVFVSFDKRRTWKQINAEAIGNIEKWVFVTPTSGIALTGKYSLAYIELDNDIIFYLDNEPGWSAWGLREDGTLFTVRQTVDFGASSVRVWLGRRRDFTLDAPWPEVELPPLPFSHRSYRTSVHFGASGEIYVASYYGLQVSRDDGRTWQQLPVLPNEQGSIDWRGVDLFVTRAGTLFARTPNMTFVSHDSGATWVQAEMPGGLANRGSMMLMEEPVPGELHFRDLPYRSTDEGRSYQQVFTLARYDLPHPLETVFYRGGEYYLHVTLLSNFVSAAPDTSLAILNPHQGATLAPGNLRRAFPLGSGRYAGLWNQGVITYTPGDIEWKVRRFLSNANFLERLSDGRLALAQHIGLRYSRDDGDTWSEPMPLFKADLPVSVRSLVTTQGRLYLGGDVSPGCNNHALLESIDNGASWQIVNLESVVDPQRMPASSHDPLMFTADHRGQLMGLAGERYACSGARIFTATSLDGGRTWTGSTDRLPLAVTSRDNLLAIEDSTGLEEAIMYWDRAQGRWQSLGPPQSNGQTIPNFFVGMPFIHVDAEDFVYFVDGHRVYRSSQPVH